MKRIVLLNASKKVLDHYKKEVKGNERISNENALKKLSRAVYLARNTKRNFKKGIDTYFYGNLRIDVCKDRIIYLENKKGKRINFKVNKSDYILASKVLGIPKEHWKHKEQSLLEKVNSTVLYALYRLIY